MNEIKIRKAYMEDIEMISTIKVRGWQTAYKDIIDKDYLDNMDITKTIEKNTKNFNNYSLIVAEQDNEIVGFCSYNYYTEDEDKNDADCELRGIYTKPELKRKGIGRKLIQYVIREFKKLDKEKMIIWCLEKNYPSRTFYEKIGGKLSKVRNITFGDKEYPIISYIFELQDELELVFPTIEYKAQVEEYLQEFFDNGELEIAGDGGLDRIKDFDEWLDKIQKDLTIDIIENNRIPSTLLNDKKYKLAEFTDKYLKEMEE